MAKKNTKRIDLDFLRRPYNTRHTLASHALDQGVSGVELSMLLGNSPRTIYEKYAGAIRKIKPPNLFD